MHRVSKCDRKKDALIYMDSLFDTYLVYRKINIGIFNVLRGMTGVSISYTSIAMSAKCVIYAEFKFDSAIENGSRP